MVIPAGSLLFNSDYPAYVVSPTGAVLLRPELYTGGTSGNTAILANGTIGFTGGGLSIYGSQLVADFGSQPLVLRDVLRPSIRGLCASDSSFFLDYDDTKIEQLSDAGAIIQTWTVAQNGGKAMAAPPDGSAVYFRLAGTGIVDIQKLTTTTGAVTTAVTESGLNANGLFAGALVCDRNGDLVAVWVDASDTSRVVVKRYRSGGTDTIEVRAGGGGDYAISLAAAPTSDHFWITVGNGAGTAVAVEQWTFTDTLVQSFSKAIPAGRWDQATFAVLRVAIGPRPPTLPTPVLVNSTPCCVSKEEKARTDSRLGDVSKGTGWTPQCTGGGTVPPPWGSC